MITNPSLPYATLPVSPVSTQGAFVSPSSAKSVAAYNQPLYPTFNAGQNVNNGISGGVGQSTTQTSAGIPMWLIIVAIGIGAYAIYRWWAR